MSCIATRERRERPSRSLAVPKTLVAEILSPRRVAATPVPWLAASPMVADAAAGGRQVRDHLAGGGEDLVGIEAGVGGGHDLAGAPHADAVDRVVEGLVGQVVGLVGLHQDPDLVVVGLRVGGRVDRLDLGQRGQPADHLGGQLGDYDRPAAGPQHQASMPSASSVASTGSSPAPAKSTISAWRGQRSFGQAVAELPGRCEGRRARPPPAGRRAGGRRPRRRAPGRRTAAGCRPRTAPAASSRCTKAASGTPSSATISGTWARPPGVPRSSGRDRRSISPAASETVGDRAEARTARRGPRGRRPRRRPARARRATRAPWRLATGPRPRSSLLVGRHEKQGFAARAAAAAETAANKAKARQGLFCAMGGSFWKG